MDGSGELVRSEQYQLGQAREIPMSRFLNDSVERLSLAGVRGKFIITIARRDTRACATVVQARLPTRDAKKVCLHDPRGGFRRPGMERPQILYLRTSLPRGPPADTNRSSANDFGWRIRPIVANDSQGIPLDTSVLPSPNSYEYKKERIER